MEGPQTGLPCMLSQGVVRAARKQVAHPRPAAPAAERAQSLLRTRTGQARAEPAPPTNERLRGGEGARDRRPHTVTPSRLLSGVSTSVRPALTQTQPPRGRESSRPHRAAGREPTAPQRRAARQQRQYPFGRFSTPFDSNESRPVVTQSRIRGGWASRGLPPSRPRQVPIQSATCSP